MSAYSSQMRHDNETTEWHVMNNAIPLTWAVPLYGYVMPIIVIITTVTNSFIIIVLSQRHLRTPTNSVLLAMALTDLMTGWTSIPWFLYYYTLEGYVIEQEIGLDPFWCSAQKYLADVLPSMFHIAAIWLTVFLAVQRYVYVCVPNAVHTYCTPRTTKIAIIFIFMLSALFVLPRTLATRRIHEIYDGRRHCKYSYLSWVYKWGRNNFYIFSSCVNITLIHFFPCLLLLIFTYKLGRTIKQAEIRKRSWAMPSEMTMDRKTSTTPKCSSNLGGRSLYATNRMLAVVCSVFLILEIPAAVVYVGNFMIGRILENEATKTQIADLFNRTLIVRNILIVLTSPIQFIIYCSMSEQFRLTVRQLFTSRLLFVAQATFHGGKRYSLILVDVETIEGKKSIAGTRPLRVVKPEEANELAVINSRRKVGRQVSFPDGDIHSKSVKVNAICRTHQSLRTTLKSTAFRRMPNKKSSFIQEHDSLKSEPTFTSELSDRRLSDPKTERTELMSPEKPKNEFNEF